ncbi:MAG: hypothetical protein II939_08090 [Bacteroidales bacterium]|nr:hypothetical protein [Bacteroidales bacterium]
MIDKYLNNIDWKQWEQTPQTYSEIDSTLYKKTLETAKKLKNMHLTVDQIIKVTGLTEREIEKL